MLGIAALAVWWGLAPALRGKFEHWHTHEHIPERLALRGFLRASRCQRRHATPPRDDAAAGD